MFLMISSRSSIALTASERAGLVISGSAAAVAHAGCQRLNAPVFVFGAGGGGGGVAAAGGGGLEGRVLVFGGGGGGGVVAGASGPAPIHATVQPNAALTF